MRTFVLVWLGQVVSLTGSNLSQFALGVWVFQQTGSVTDFALTVVCEAVPPLLLSPVAGTLVDRYDRRWIMLLADAGAALSTLLVVVIVSSGGVSLWLVYAAITLSATANTFQQPAYAAAVALLVPREHLGRASGMIELGGSIGQIVAPVLAGGLLAWVGLRGILLIDCSTFAVAVAALLLVRFPPTPRSQAGQQELGSVWRAAAHGANHVTRNPSLVALLVFLAIINVSFSFVTVLVSPMLLIYTSPTTLGSVLSIAAAGGLLGGLVMSTWGGPRRRTSGVLGFSVLLGLGLMVAGLRPSTVLMAGGGFLMMFAFPLIGGSNQAIWQATIPPDLQGRVYALRSLVAHATRLTAYLLAGPLAEHVAEPWMVSQGPVAASVGRLIGTGPGRGIGLIFVVLGAFTLGSIALLRRRVRRLEETQDTSQQGTHGSAAHVEAK